MVQGSANAKLQGLLASHATLPVRRLGEHKELGGDSTRTADPDCPKGYSISCGVMPNNKTGGKLARRRGNNSRTG